MFSCARTALAPAWRLRLTERSKIGPQRQISRRYGAMPWIRRTAKPGASADAHVTFRIGAGQLTQSSSSDRSIHLIDRDMTRAVPACGP